MRRIIFTILSIFFLVSPILSQEILSESEMKLKIGLNEARKSIPVVNEKAKELSLFIIDKKAFHLNKYNKAFELVYQQKFERPKTKTKNIKAVVVPNPDEYLFLSSNDNNKKLELLSLNIKDKETEVITKPLISKKERFLHTFTHENLIYIITLQPNTSKLNIHKIKEKNNIEILEYDLAKEVFFDYNGDVSSLYNAFLIPDGNSVKFNLEIELIKTGIPNSLYTTSKLIKLYIQDKNTITISFDKGHKFTQLITLNLDIIDYTIKTIQKPVLSITREYDPIKSNSFLSKDKLYQIVSNNDQMKFAVTNLESKKIIKELVLHEKDSITFKNTPIITKGSAHDDYLETEKTRKFLRNIASENNGIVMFEKDSIVKITLGGVSEAPSGTLTMIHGTPSVDHFTSPTHYAYTGYTKARSTYIHCLFNQKLQHIPGEVLKNAFDKIQDFSKDLKNLKVETIFKFNKHYVYGYYDSQLKKYFLRKFEG